MQRLQQTPPQTIASPLHHERRETGAHAILALLLLSYLVGIVMTLVIGATIGPLSWWLLQWVGLTFQSSLAIDIAAVLILACLLTGVVRRSMMELSPDDAWAGSLFTIILTITVLLLSKLLDPAVLAITGPAFPFFRPALVPLKLEFSLPGMEVTAALVLLAHRQVWRRYRMIGPKGRQRSYSHIHVGGSLWSLLEQAFKLYQKGLARFQPPPIEHLNIPFMVHYYEPKEAIEDPEHAIYWIGHALILPFPFLGPNPEQADVLLPLLARALYDYHSSQLLVDELLALGFCCGKGWLTGVILWLPLLMTHVCKKQWDDLHRDQVLDRDRFAYWCGEGKRLHAFLWKQLQRVRQSGNPDTSVPTLTERIDHLDSLLRKEARQVNALRAMLPPASPNANSLPSTGSKKEE